MKEESIKRSARSILSGRWPEAIGVVTIGLVALLLESTLASLLQYVFFSKLIQLGTFLSLVTLALDLFVFSPLYLGIIRWFWQITGGEDEPVASVLIYYQNAENYFLTIKLRLSLWWRVIVAALISMSPAIAVMIAAEAFNSIGGNLSHLYSPFSTASSVLLVLGAVVTLIYLLRFFLVPAILFSDKGVTVTDAFRLSKALTYKKRGRAFFTLILSFSGWAVLSIFILPIIYTLPFYLASFLIISRNRIDEFVTKSTENTAEKG